MWKLKITLARSVLVKEQNVLWKYLLTEGLSQNSYHEQLQQQHQQKQQGFVLDLTDDEFAWGCCEELPPPFPLVGDATVGVAVFGGGAPEGVAPPAASEIVTMPPSPEVTEVFVMAACPFPMAVSSAAEAEIEFEATVVILESETVLEGAPTIWTLNKINTFSNQICLS